jgi:hypothetical protein
MTAASTLSSDTLWAAVGAIVALIGAAVPFILYWFSNRRPVLLYTPVATSLLSTHAPRITDGDIRVTFKGQSLTDPHLVTLRVDSRSRKDIADRDFNAGKPLVIRLGTSFAAPVSEPTEVHVDKLSIENSDISIGPCKISRGPVAQLQFVTEGPPDIEAKNPLIDIDVRPDNEEYRERRRRLRRKAFSTSSLFIAIYIIIGVFFNTADPHFPGLSPLHSWVQYFISILFWPLSLWHPTFTMGKWTP